MVIKGVLLGRTVTVCQLLREESMRLWHKHCTVGLGPSLALIKFNVIK